MSRYGTPREVAPYRPLCASLLSDRPDPVLGFDIAFALTARHAARPVAR